MALANQPGITVRLHTVIGQDLSFWQLQEQFDAILLAIGLQYSVPLGVSGEELLQGVMPALDFLKQYHLQHVQLCGDVAVIGGGRATIDVARLAIRAGAHTVRVFLPGALSDLPVRREECDAAGKEGVLFHPAEMPRSIIGTEEATVHGVRCQSTLRERTEARDEQTFTYCCGTDRWYFLNTVLVAVGEEADQSCLSGVDLRLPFQRNSGGREEGSCTTNLPGVFVAGDIAGGPHTLQHAFISGYEAAHVMHSQLCNHPALQHTLWQRTDMPVTC
jgi:NADPH-dependent glutamate synthase beta subunit-like oxidoreductase